MNNKVIVTVFLVFKAIVTTVCSQNIDPNSLVGLHQLTSTELNTALNLNVGQLVYNTTEKAVYVYAESGWKKIASNQNKKLARWTNTNTTTNLVPTKISIGLILTEIDLGDEFVDIPLFGNQILNNATGTFEKASASEIVVKESGLYLISVNLHIKSTDGRAGISAQIFSSNQRLSAIGQSSYIRNAENHNQSSIHISDIFKLSSNSRLSVKTKSITDATKTVTFYKHGSSNFSIVKIN